MHTPTRLLRHSLAGLTLLVAAACVPDRTRAGVEAAVQRSHELFDAERFGVMYDEADVTLRTAYTKPQFIQVMEMMYAKLGSTMRSEQTGMTMSITSGGGTQVEVAYRTQFARAQGVERFVFRIRNNRPRLHRWNVDSPVFLEK